MANDCGCKALTTSPGLLSRSVLPGGGIFPGGGWLLEDRPRWPGGAACSALPEGTRQKVAQAWEPVARVYQLYAGFQMAMLPSLIALQGPFALFTWPFITFGVLMNVVPYIAVELAINCNPAEQVKRQAKMAREALELVNRVPEIVPIPGLSDIKRAINMVIPFLRAAETGAQPPLAAWNDLAKAAGVMDAFPVDLLGPIEAGIEAAGIKFPTPPSVEPWSKMTPGAGKAGANAAKAARDAAVAKSKASAKQKAIAVAKAKAKATLYAKMNAEKAAAAGMSTGAYLQTQGLNMTSVGPSTSAAALVAAAAPKSAGMSTAAKVGIGLALLAGGTKVAGVW